LPELGHADAERILAAAAALITCDGKVLESEERVYDSLAARLKVGDRKKRQLLQHYRRLTWV
jgi:hypothetical protein